MFSRLMIFIKLKHLIYHVLNFYMSKIFLKTFSLFTGMIYPFSILIFVIFVFYYSPYLCGDNKNIIIIDLQDIAL